MKRSTRPLRFAVVGVANTALDFLVFIVLVRGADLSPLVANCAAFLVAVSNSYALNRRWTFAAQEATGTWAALQTYALFVAVNSLGLVLGTSTIYLLQSWMPVEMAKLVSVAVTMTWNYLGSSRFVFGHRRRNE